MAVTGEQVKEAALAAGIEEVAHHECGGCWVTVNYVVVGEDLFFDSNCDCGPCTSELQPRSWDDAADWINMNKGEERKRIAALFGLALEEEVDA